MVHAGTDSYGSNILQLAELKLMVVFDVPLVEFIAINLTPAVGELVVFLKTSHWYTRPVSSGHLMLGRRKPVMNTAG